MCWSLRQHPTKTNICCPICTGEGELGVLQGSMKAVILCPACDGDGALDLSVPGVATRYEIFRRIAEC